MGLAQVKGRVEIAQESGAALGLFPDQGDRGNLDFRGENEGLRHEPPLSKVRVPEPKLLWAQKTERSFALWKKVRALLKVGRPQRGKFSAVTEWESMPFAALALPDVLIGRMT